MGKVAPAFLLSLLGGRGGRRSAPRRSSLGSTPASTPRCWRRSAWSSGPSARAPSATRFDDGVLRRLTMPVLAVLGARDRVFDPSTPAVTTLLPDVQDEVVPSAGHALLGQVPRIAEFLRAGRDQAQHLGLILPLSCDEGAAAWMRHGPARSSARVTPGMIWFPPCPARTREEDDGDAGLRDAR
jgi:hypothetical protein